MSALIIAFLVYLFLVVLIGVLSSRAVDSQSEFLLGGQRLPGWAIAISERASGESAWLLLGLTGAALSVGLGEIWTVIGCVAGILFLWFFVGGRVRRALSRYDAITVPEFLAQRFNDPGNSIRVLASLIIIFFFSFYVAAQMVGAGKVLQKTGIISDITAAWLNSALWHRLLLPAAGLLGWAPETTDIYLSPAFWGILLGAFIVIAYTLAGGFRAVVWTDLLQGMIMIVALVALPLVGLIELREQHAHLAGAVAAVGPDKASWVGGKSGWAALSLVLGGLAWGLGYMGQPHLLVRFMALPDPDEIPRLRWLAGTWTVLAYGGAFMVGLIALGIYGGEFFEGDAEKIMPTLAAALLPGWIAGIVISGAVAAMMSTADSQLLVVTSAFSEDLCCRVFRRRLTAREQVSLSRLIVLLVGGAAFALALSSRETVYSMVSYAWSGLGASFGPVILLTILWRRFHRYAALATMMAGTAYTISWKSSPLLESFVSHRFAAWSIALLVGVMMTLVIRPRNVDHVAGSLFSD